MFMKKLAFLLLLISIPLAQGAPLYNPNAYVHARVSSLGWVADDDFSADLIGSIQNYNLSRYSYVWINVTLEYWNPNAVPVIVRDPLDRSADASGGLLVEADHNVTIAMPRDLGCFEVYRQLDTGDEADCKGYVESQFEGMSVNPGLSTVSFSTIVRFNQSNVDDWVPGTYTVYPLSISTVPYFVVKNETGVFDFPGELPEGWGSTQGLGYSVSLFRLPISSILLLYGFPLLVIAVIVAMALKRRKTIKQKEG